MSAHSIDQPIKTGLVAYGMSGKVFHAPFLEVHPGFILHAVTERNQKKAVNDYPHIISYDSLDALLADSSIELIVINSPNYLHFEHSKAALDAGKHILVEKPFTATTSEAAQLFEMAKEKGLKIMVYQNRRYSSDFLSAKEIIASGKLGNLIELNFRFDRYKNQIGPKKFKEEPYPGSGIIYDLGAHILDQIISLYGKPEKAFKTSGKYRANTEVPDYGHYHLIYANQINAYVTVSMMTAQSTPGIVIHGTKGSFIKPFADVQETQSISGMRPNHPEFGIEKPEHQGKLTLVKEDGGLQEEYIPGKKGNMLGLFEDVFQYIRNDIEFPVKSEEVLIQLELLEKSDC